MQVDVNNHGWRKPWTLGVFYYCMINMSFLDMASLRLRADNAVALTLKARISCHFCTTAATRTYQKTMKTTIVSDSDASYF